MSRVRQTFRNLQNSANVEMSRLVADDEPDLAHEPPEDRLTQRIIEALAAQHSYRQFIETKTEENT
jgi:hypothetical protein